MYQYILSNAEVLESKKLFKLLREHEINCISKWLKSKFNDTRTVDEISSIIIDEYALEH